jgi:hypothetical protein
VWLLHMQQPSYCKSVMLLSNECCNECPWLHLRFSMRAYTQNSYKHRNIMRFITLLALHQLWIGKHCSGSKLGLAVAY